MWVKYHKQNRMQAQENEIILEMYHMAKPPGLCRSEGAEIPVLFRDLISRLCLIIEEGGFLRYP